MGDAAVYDLAAVVAERDALRKDFDAALAECKLLTHKVITCGVAASHPDANLAHTGAYKEKWDSPQAEEVRKLRAERDALKAEVAQADAEYQDAITLAQSNKDRLDVALAEVALRKSEVELFRDKLKAQCDEVAKLKAACAVKDEAIGTLRDHITVGMYRAVPHLAEVAASALSDDAGRNYIDATGAVETMALPEVADGNAWVDDTPLPAAWVGKSVLIVVKP